MVHASLAHGMGLTLLMAILLVMTGPATAGKKRSVPYRRMQDTVRGSSSGAAKTGSGVLAPLGSLEHLNFLQDLAKNGLDPLAIITEVVGGDEFKKIYENEEIMHKILEAQPLLAAIPGFTEAADRKLSGDEMKNAFVQGMETLVEFSKTATAFTKDPSSSASYVNELRKSEDKSVQEALSMAADGSREGVEKLQSLMADGMFGVNFDKMKEVASKQTFSKILDSPDLMHYIDQDEHMSDVFRKGYVLPGNLNKPTPSN